MSAEAVKDIRDPEHPYTLEELSVVSLSDISLSPGNIVTIRIHPTVPHCSFAPIIGLSVKAKLYQVFGISLKVELAR